MVCQEKEDHVEMNISDPGSEAALYEACGPDWNQILTLKEKASGSCHMMKPGTLPRNLPEVLWSAISLHTESSTFPKENEFFLLTERHHFRSLNWVKNKGTSEKVTHNLWGLSDFLIHSNTDGFFFLISKGKSLTVIEWIKGVRRWFLLAFFSKK